MDFNSADFEELYQSIILDHSRRPRNFGELADATVTASGDNPSCGDQITLQLKLGEDGRVDDVKFHGDGCSICMASASMMTTKIKHKDRVNAETLRDAFQAMLADQTGAEAVPPSKALGDLSLLQGVRKFPQRIKCATLAWHALRQALHEDSAKRVVVDVEGHPQTVSK